MDQPWPADHVERRDIADLLPYARNARRHSPAQIAQIAASIREWGWTIPVLIDEGGTIIAGHARVLAAHQLKIASVPVLIARGWTDAQRRAYTIADNKLTLNSEWDMGLLKLELPELRAEGFDLALTGFAEQEIEALEGLSVDSPIDEWEDMPSFDQPHRLAFRSVIVHFRDEAAAQEFGQRIGQPLPANAKYIWFPAAERRAVKDKAFAADEP